ncbi:hypothetical protein, partial [Bacillus pseudomycoides]|uniref:hypothetical protein n=1 Tax=Bacillus pseudomycoides TaxID=64104 RepID=UPI001C3F34A7
AMKKRQVECTRLPFPFPVGSGTTHAHQFTQLLYIVWRNRICYFFIFGLRLNRFFFTSCVSTLLEQPVIINKEVIANPVAT